MLSESNYLELKNRDFSFFGLDSKIYGEFHLCGHIRIASTLEGKIYISDKGELTIERGGVVKGDIEGNNIDIYGEFRGNIYSKGKVILRPSCLIVGRIEALNLVIFPGAQINIDGTSLVGE